MFEINFYQKIASLAECHSGNIHEHHYHVAIGLFNSAILNGKISRIRSKILNRRIWLYDLESIRSAAVIHGSFYAGIKVISISDIIGTEGRVTDFDVNFHPIDERSRERWVNMALANINHVPLPPIKVTQVGDKYFVQDGHHRISVAHALGQAAMDAEVVVWKVHSTLPWQKSFQLQPAQLAN
jgi:hypothetical protein